ncbi:MAG: tRNA (adenosine(37)-N6)-threonylcarbamoyltransferase complex ATPase subunit type 1 TsaE [Prolixibacteraceae bacterium]|nr:tRNA (adenosine(37)-N6)-threonylcarbamoyltransferase complex ATPase subunit type 1 TsaE [Prolixibacteraceae bacterium]MBN2650517.1 tRNA (adenosine(37)-N6)-threonylcarbamoyltransferase complex ATPase subunit type 1 TsaE [Prolixibacteraceae bacterium]
MKLIQIESLETIRQAAREFIEAADAPGVFAFYGAMGAGKTTFIKAICRELGVSDNITSPSFSLINEYVANDGSVIYHFDCYRLKNPAEAYDIGAEEYFYSGHWCFVEWPERIEDLLPDNTKIVRLTVANDGVRTVELV